LLHVSSIIISREATAAAWYKGFEEEHMHETKEKQKK